MQIEVEYRPYSRPFRQPLQTAHGAWNLREGILLRLTDETGRAGFGEISPIHWFGSESVEVALACCENLKGFQEAARLKAISPALTACQFGFGLALWNLQASFADGKGEFFPESLGGDSRSGVGRTTVNPYQRNGGLGNERVCGLLPAGERALAVWQALWEQGHRTFKWKVGVYGVGTELGWLRELVTALPPGSWLRLDANGGLTKAEAVQWLKVCEELPGIEFMEQPLPPAQFETMRQLSQRYRTSLALDESVATLAQLKDCYQRDWPGIYVVKPAICGDPLQVRAFIQTYGLDVVVSSALETAVGRRGAIALFTSKPNSPLEAQDPALGEQPCVSTKSGRPERAIGFGTGDLFEDDWDTLPAEALWAIL